MPKVLRILNRFNIGGPTYNAVYLSKYISPEFETMLIGGDIDSTEASSLYIAQNEGLNPVVLTDMKRSINPFADKRALNRIKEIIKEFRPDIVHTHASKAGLLGRRAAFSMGVPVVVHTFHGHVFHSYFNPLKTALIKRIERNLAQKSSAIVAISKEQKNELVNIHKICPDHKMTVIPLGFDLGKFEDKDGVKRKKFRETYAIEDHETVITIVGRLVAVKNHAFFINAVKRIVDTGRKHLRFFIVGDGEERGKITGMMDKTGIDYCYWPNSQKKAIVTLTSWSKEVDVVNAGSDIVVLTSLNEGTPVSLIEAQAAGKPVVSTRTGGINNIVVENQSAFLTGTDELEKFVQYVCQIIDNKSLALKMGAAGHAFVMDEFSYKTLCRNTENLYRRLLDARHK
jgi:glycosyltransferase involved in cell wall biosynthesis